jgi:hypothetical protein
MAHIKPIRYKIILEGETMSTVTGTFTVSVAPAIGPPPPPALAINPASGSLPGEVEGTAIAAGVVATVSGGVPPYSYTITGQPAGVTFSEVPSADGIAGDADVVIAGTPAAGDSTGGDGKGNYNVSIVVTDSASPAAASKLNVAVRKL